MTDKSLISTVTKLTDLLPYPEEGLKVKPIIDEHDSFVGAISFNGGKLETHTAPCNAMLVAMEGEAVVTIDGKNTKVKAGEMIVLPENVPHSVTPCGKFKMIIIKAKK